MNDLPALLSSITALVVALGGFVAVLVKLRSNGEAQAATSAKVDAIHAATVTETQPGTVAK